MKHLSVALVVIAVVAAAFGAQALHFSAGAQHSWHVIAMVALLVSGGYWIAGDDA